MLEIVEIKNRNNIKLSLRINSSKDNKNCVFLVHGLASRNDYPHMLVLEEEFYKFGYNVINIDMSNSLNKSGFSNDGVTFTNFINDLEDVIKWSKDKDFYYEPFALAGQSLGAETVIYYASFYPNKVNLLVSLAFPWINGKIESILNKRRKDIKEKGYYEQVSKSTGRTLIIKKNYLDDLEKYNLEDNISNIKAKTYLVVGDKDTKYHIDNNKTLYDKLNCFKKLYVLKGVPHDMANEIEHKNKLMNTLDEILSNN